MKIALIGAGQQGTSQGLAFANLKRVEQVIFYDIDPAVAEQVYLKTEEGFGVDKSKIVFANSIQSAVAEADVIGINTPMSAFKGVAAEISQHAKKGATLYDNGLGKVQAIKDIREGLGENSSGLHYFPMHFFVYRAGTGVEFADAEMYRGQTVAIMEGFDMRTQLSLLAKANLTGLLQDIDVGNIRTDLTPVDHDESLGLYFHHNTFAAIALMLAFPQVEINGEPVQVGRFLSSTRVAAHGADGATFFGLVANDNSMAIFAAAHIFSKKLDDVKAALQEGSDKDLQAMFMDANRYASDIEPDRAFEGLDGDRYDLGVLVADRAGFEEHAASHIAMPMVFAMASALTAREYEINGGQPFSSIGNSSFHDSIRPVRANFNAAVEFIWDRREAVLAAVGALHDKHCEITNAIAFHEAAKIAGFIQESYRIRSQLPDASRQVRPEYVAI